MSIFFVLLWEITVTPMNNNAYYGLDHHLEEISRLDAPGWIQHDAFRGRSRTDTLHPGQGRLSGG